MELTIDDFIKMEEIEHQYFLDENISPAIEAFRWYQLDPNSCIVVKDNSKVVAYVNILSLNKEVYYKIKNNEMNESQIIVSDLELEKDKYFNYLYFSTIAVDKKHRNIQTIKKLIDITKHKILELVNQGYFVKEVMADCSTFEGQKITQKLLKLKPLKKTSHSSVLYTLNGNEFIYNIKNLM